MFDADGASWQDGCGEQEDGCPEPLGGSHRALVGKEKRPPYLSQRRAECPQPIPQHLTATVLVSKEHSSEGTYVLLFLGD